jgi:hypothetical protein
MTSKRIDIHKDYLMNALNSNVGNSLHLLITHMQDTTPYGDEYIKAFEQYKKVREELKILEYYLAECVEIKENK